MTSAPATDEAISYATIDADGRVIAADPVFAALNDHAGGAVGQPLAVPSLATIARLARQLGILVSRGVVVGDLDAPVDLWVRAEPVGDTVRLAVSGWQEGRRPPERAGRNNVAAIGADLAWDVDASLRLTYIGFAAARALGLDAVALLGKPITALFAFDGQEEGSLALLEAVAHRRPLEGQHAQLRAPVPRDVILSAHVRRDPTGAFAGFSGAADLVRDAVASPPSAALSTIVTDGLDRALRRPLARIVATADTINAAVEGPVSQEYAGYAADIANAGRHLLALVDDLVDLRAIESADFTPVVEPIDLADVARRAAGLLAVRAADAGVAIARPLPSLSVPASGDFRRALQVLVNLIGNALRYSPGGGVVTVSVANGHDGAIAVVDDQGKGIDPADHERIFAKFERLDPSEPGGSGLGLYIARRLTRAMGGDLMVESAPGEGARFILTLPPQPPRREDQQ